jgi:hypothetical protein
MRSKVLTYLFLFVFQAANAPVIDFHLKIDVIMAGTLYLDKKHHEAEFGRFISDLGRSESGNNWLCVNCIGCFGEWQFAESTVHYLGYKNITLRKFRTNPAIFPREKQREVLESLIKVNLALLRDYDRFIGDTVGGVVITKSGMIAASHLGGAGSLKLFLLSNGRISKTDILGTSVCDYLNKFRYYDLN